MSTLSPRDAQAALLMAGARFCPAWLDPNHLNDPEDEPEWEPLPPIECSLEAGHPGRHVAYEEGPR